MGGYNNVYQWEAAKCGFSKFATKLHVSYTVIDAYFIFRNGDGYLEKEEILEAVPPVVQIAHMAHLLANVDQNPHQVTTICGICFNPFFTVKSPI